MDQVLGTGVGVGIDDNWTRFDNRVFAYILLFTSTLSLAIATSLANRSVPDTLISNISQIPPRFAKLYVKKRSPALAPKQAVPEPEVPTRRRPEKSAANTQHETIRDAKLVRPPRSKILQSGILGAISAARTSNSAFAALLNGDKSDIARLDSALADLNGTAIANLKTGMGTPVVQRRNQLEGIDIGSLASDDARQMKLAAKSENRVVASIQKSAPVVHGTIDQSYVRAFVEKRLAAIKYCYEKELAGNPHLSGKVITRFTIIASGTVENPEIVSSTLDNNNVETCILRRIRRWKFKQVSGHPVDIQYPFLFSARG